MIKTRMMKFHDTQILEWSYMILIRWIGGRNEGVDQFEFKRF